VAQERVVTTDCGVHDRPALPDRSPVSIIVSTHNRVHCLRQVLACLVWLFAAELDAGSAEILVFDDASTDETAAVCAQYQHHVCYLSTQRQVGCIEARRRLMRQAKGEYVLQLDDDSCLLDPEALDRVRMLFASRPDCAIIAANIASPRLPSGYAPTGIEPMAVGSFIGCGCAFRASAVRRIGSYPAFLAGYGAEEIALSLLVLDRGYQILFLPSLRVHHALDISQRPEGRRRGTSFANEAVTIIALYPAWLVLPALAYKTATYLLYNARQRSLRGFLGVQRELPSRLRHALRARAAVRHSTIRLFYTLRGTFERVRTDHAQCVTSRERWPDIGGILSTAP